MVSISSYLFTLSSCSVKENRKKTQYPTFWSGAKSKNRYYSMRLFFLKVLFRFVFFAFNFKIGLQTLIPIFDNKRSPPHHFCFFRRHRTLLEPHPDYYHYFLFLLGTVELNKKSRYLFLKIYQQSGNYPIYVKSSNTYSVG